MKALLVLGAFLIMFSLVFVEPQGPFFVSESDSCSTPMKVQVPSYLREKGYPRIVLVDRDYVYENWGFAWKDFLNATFKPEGVYDYRRNRVLSPEEAAYLVVGCIPDVEVNWGKAIFFAFGVCFMIMGFISPPSSRREESRSAWREVGGMA